MATGSSRGSAAAPAAIVLPADRSGESFGLSPFSSAYSPRWRPLAGFAEPIDPRSGALRAPLPAASAAAQIASGFLSGLVIWSVLYCIVSLLRLHPFGDTNTFPENQPVSFPVLIASYWHRLRFGLLIAIPVFTVALAWMKPDLSSILVRATRLGLAAFAFSALWIVPQLFYLAFNLRESPSFDHTSAQARSIRSRRIVWILLDELSYNLVFDHPPSGQQFPNLQSLRSRSTSLGNIKPVGVFTDRIVPSLLAGREIDQIRGTRSRNLLYMNQAQHEWAQYDPNTTLFKLAQTNGWNSGVAGWFNPYCRIFAATLTTCSSEPGIGASFPLNRGDRPKKNLFFPMPWSSQ